MTGPRTPRLAANPIPCWRRRGRLDTSREVVHRAFRDVMIEIDEPRADSVVESHRMAFARAREHLPAVV